TCTPSSDHAATDNVIAVRSGFMSIPIAANGQSSGTSSTAHESQYFFGITETPASSSQTPSRSLKNVSESYVSYSPCTTSWLMWSFQDGFAFHRVRSNAGSSSGLAEYST